MGTVAYPVRTARLLLRPLGEDDVEDVEAYRSRSDVCRWVPFDPMSRSEVLDRIRASLGELTDEGRALTAGVELPAAAAPDGVVDSQPEQRGIVIGDVVLIWRSREHATGDRLCLSSRLQRAGIRHRSRARAARHRVRDLGLHRSDRRA